MSDLPRNAVTRTANLAALPLSFAGRAGPGPENWCYKTDLPTGTGSSAVVCAAEGGAHV
jgi:hypothetical protein